MRIKIIWLLEQFFHGKILDAGCGGGEWTMRFGDVTGIDIDRERLNRARENGIDAVWMDLDGGLKFPDKHFDTVFCSNSLEHLAFPFGALREFYRVLKCDGTLILGIPNANAMIWDESEYPSHIHSWTDKTIKHLLRNSGFKVVVQYTNSPFTRKTLIRMWNCIPIIKKHWVDLWYICEKYDGGAE